MQLSVVIDNGSGYTKLGYAENINPQFVFPTTVATRIVGKTRKNFIGSQALEKDTKNHELIYPVKNGMIQNWDAMEWYWQQCFFNHLRCDLEETCVLLTEPPYNFPENREKTAEIMFETFDIPGLHIGVQAVLSLISSWSDTKKGLTGVVVDSGEGVTHIVPVVSGYVIESAIQSIPVAGKEATLFMQQLLRENGEPSLFDMCKKLKEKETYVAKNVLEEFKKYEKDQSFCRKTEDGIFLGYEQFMVPEVILNPEIAQKKGCLSLSETIDLAIQKCPIDTRRSLYENIVLSGGTTQFRGFAERLQDELSFIAHKRLENVVEDKQTVFVSQNKKHKHAVWSGGSIFASMNEFQSYCVRKEDYFETGSGIFRKSNVFGDLFI